MPLPFDLSRITEDDLQALVQARATENSNLEFKQQLPGSDNAGKHELTADVSAFANAGGGDIVYGVAEDGDACATNITPLTGNQDQEVRRLQDILMNGIEPRIPGLAVSSVPVTGGFCVIIRVPKSWIGPHRVKSNQHFFVRESGRKRQLDMPEIKSLFLRAAGFASQVRDFRTDRVGRLIAGESPQPLVPGARLVLHFFPTQTAIGGSTIDPVAYLTAERRLPIYGTTAGNARVNVDGALSVRNTGASDETHGYSLLFRNGIFESVTVLKQYSESGRFILGSQVFEDYTIQLVQGLHREYGHFGIAKEMLCLATIIDGKQTDLGLDRFNYSLDGTQGSFDRDIVPIPDVLIEGVRAPEDELRPVFDLIWQSAGLSRSHNYDDDGNRIVRR
ncbi:hypothetical protein PAP18089_02645 [Pandoraea apista]|uniref:Schlafen AlbA-2 domain-containing protein n=1 Tax=Pandoraea apista TaxID=93218 RepID=A0A5E5P5P2_9BURK|nr:ATP-binding protein [Pandoraea apista]VVG71660.1 hypothetical protein PAP18089_02645 [Pandoraea apista]